MEGIITVLLGIAGYFLIVPFPDQDAWKSKGFLTQREVEYVIAIVDQDRGDAHTEGFTWGRFLRPALQPKVWGELFHKTNFLPLQLLTQLRQDSP